MKRVIIMFVLRKNVIRVMLNHSMISFKFLRLIRSTKTIKVSKWSHSLKIRERSRKKRLLWAKRRCNSRHINRKIRHLWKIKEEEARILIFFLHEMMSTLLLISWCDRYNSITTIMSHQLLTNLTTSKNSKHTLYSTLHIFTLTLKLKVVSKLWAYFKYLDLRSMKSFDHYICYLFLTKNVLNNQLSSPNFLPHSLKVNLCMFGIRM